ncbi:MAG: fatty acid desaturase [Acidimicrobiales bacterium]
MFSTVLWGILVGFVLTQIANVATTVYLHRALAHKAVTLSEPLVGTFRGIIWLLTGIRPRQWAAVHRKHHAFTDEDADPHSPLQLGWVRVQLTNVALYRKVAQDREQVAKFARDLPPTWADRWFLDHALLGLGLTTIVLILFMGWVGGLVAVGFHFVLYLSLSAAVNAVAHTFGKRPFENSATNLQWLAWLTCGEGLHNNHHAAPTSARFSLDEGQMDPGWLVIRAARKLGLATIRHDVPVFATPRAA